MTGGTRPRSGRRVAARTRRRVPLAAAAALLPLLFGGLAWIGPAADDPVVEDPATVAGDRLPVDEVELLCPAVGRSGGATVVARPALAAAQPDQAVLLAGRPGAAGTPIDLPLGPSVRLDPGGGGTALRVDGPGAPAVFGDVTVADGAGLAAASCPTPATTWWFAGGGAGARHRTALSVTNLDSGPAVVDVRLHGADGPLPAESLRGVTLAPAETRSWSWADVVPGEELLTAEVRAVRGRVVATTREEAEGRDWLAPGAPPATQQRLAAVPAGRGRSQLTVTNPGTATARVTVRVVTRAGAFVPVERGELVVEPGAVAALDLTEPLDGESAAVDLAADTPVVAALRHAPRGGRDVATVAAVPPLDAPGAVGAGPGRTVLHLSAGDAAATAEVRAVAADGEVIAEDLLSARPSTLVTWTAPPRAAYLVVVPTRGAPYAAAVRASDSGVAVVPVTALPWERTLPEVLPQPAS